VIGHERIDCRFLVLPGSEATVTEITEYIYFSLMWTQSEFKYKSKWNTVPSVLIIGLIPFLRNTFYYIPAVRGWSEYDFSILGRKQSLSHLECLVWKPNLGALDSPGCHDHSRTTSLPRSYIRGYIVRYYPQQLMHLNPHTLVMNSKNQSHTLLGDVGPPNPMLSLRRWNTPSSWNHIQGRPGKIRLMCKMFINNRKS